MAIPLKYNHYRGDVVYILILIDFTLFIPYLCKLGRVALSRCVFVGGLVVEGLISINPTYRSCVGNIFSGVYCDPHILSMFR